MGSPAVALLVRVLVAARHALAPPAALPLLVPLAVARPALAGRAVAGRAAVLVARPPRAEVVSPYSG